VQEKPKGRSGMDVATDCEAPDTFYRAEEGGETVVEEKRSAVSGGGGDLSSGESDFLCKRNPKEDGEWMW
jgi:hypothetical protein